MKKITYKTVIAIVGAIVLLLQNFGLRLDVEVADAIATAIGGILVAVGVVLPDKKVESAIQDNLETQREQIEENQEKQKDETEE